MRYTILQVVDQDAGVACERLETEINDWMTADSPDGPAVSWVPAGGVSIVHANGEFYVTQAMVHADLDE